MYRRRPQREESVGEICCLFNDAVSSSDYLAWDDGLINELVRMEESGCGLIKGTSSSFDLGLSKTTKTQDFLVSGSRF
jgi:hypothetical protein